MAGLPVSIATMIAQGASLLDILAAGYSSDAINTALRARQQAQNVSAQQALNYPTAQGAIAWARRKLWLLDGQAIHGDTAGLADFYYPWLAAVQTDDQATAAKQADLVFKALYTILGDPNA